MAQARRRPAYATSEAVAEQVQVWSQEVVDCRAFGHEWGPYTARWRGVEIDVTLSCQRCTAFKRFTIDSRTGMYVHPAYVAYPVGYLVKGLGRIVGDVKGQVRLAAVAKYAPARTRKRLRSVGEEEA